MISIYRRFGIQNVFWARRSGWKAETATYTNDVYICSTQRAWACFSGNALSWHLYEGRNRNEDWFNGSKSSGKIIAQLYTTLVPFVQMAWIFPGNKDHILTYIFNTSYWKYIDNILSIHKPYSYSNNILSMLSMLSNYL